jgi:2-phospho-L-lactate transferase/gluconeogenesis factor (CofD/UPF0052 family)
MRVMAIFKNSSFIALIAICQRYGLGVPALPVYMTTTKLSAQQPSRRRLARTDAINQHGDQDKPRQVYLDDSKDQSVVTN